jgi:hypothetical protein
LLGTHIQRKASRRTIPFGLSPAGIVLVRGTLRCLLGSYLGIRPATALFDDLLQEGDELVTGSCAAQRAMPISEGPLWAVDKILKKII